MLDIVILFTCSVICLRRNGMVVKRIDNAKIVFLSLQFFLLTHGFFPSTITDLEKMVSIGISCIGLLIVAFSIKDSVVQKKVNYLLVGIFLLSVSLLLLILTLWVIEFITFSMGN